VVGLLVAEVLTTRIIALKRQVHLASPVQFGARQVDAERFRAAGPESPARLEEAPAR
jgi:hypothetical protein